MYAGDTLSKKKKMMMATRKRKSTQRGIGKASKLVEEARDPMSFRILYNLITELSRKKTEQQIEKQ